MKIVLKYGAGIAVVMALVTLFVIHVIGIEQEWARRFMMLTPFPVVFASVLLGIKERKIFFYNNEMNYSQALFSGVQISFVGAALLFVFNTIYYSANTDFVEQVIAVSKPLMLQLKYTTKQIEENTEIIRRTYTIEGQAASALMMLIMGIVFSAVISAFLRNKDTFTQVFKK